MKNRKIPFRLTPAALAALLLVLALAGGTLAWLVSATPAITNTFRAGEVDVDIDEEFENDVKENVTLTNPQDDKHVPIYVRAALVPTWVDDNGQPLGEPADLIDLDIKWGTADWIYNAPDGYYYYKHVLPVGESTANLIDEAVVITANGKRMNLQVIADAVQANPKTAVMDVWPVTVNESGTLALEGGEGS